MLLMKILIAINILYLIIEDFRTKTVSIYYCISLFMLSTTYAMLSKQFIIWNIIFGVYLCFINQTKKLQ